jgi:hypothetical protein
MWSRVHHRSRDRMSRDGVDRHLSNFPGQDWTGWASTQSRAVAVIWTILIWDRCKEATVAGCGAKFIRGQHNLPGAWRGRSFRSYPGSCSRFDWHTLNCETPFASATPRTASPTSPPPKRDLVGHDVAWPRAVTEEAYVPTGLKLSVAVMRHRFPRPHWPRRCCWSQ